MGSITGFIHSDHPHHNIRIIKCRIYFNLYTESYFLVDIIALGIPVINYLVAKYTDAARRRHLVSAKPNRC